MTDRYELILTAEATVTKAPKPQPAEGTKPKEK